MFGHCRQLDRVGELAVVDTEIKTPSRCACNAWTPRTKFGSNKLLIGLELDDSADALHEGIRREFCQRVPRRFALFERAPWHNAANARMARGILPGTQSAPCLKLRDVALALKKHQS